MKAHLFTRQERPGAPIVTHVEFQLPSPDSASLMNSLESIEIEAAYVGDKADVRSTLVEIRDAFSGVIDMMDRGNR